MKKTLISFAIAIALLSSCTTTAKKETVETPFKTSSVVSITKEKVTPVDSETAAVPKALAALVPIAVLDSKSSDVYEKYGIEFSGNCYACDLANLSIADNKMVWTNVCDEKDTYVMDGFTFDAESNKYIFTTSDRIFTLTQIDQAPVYKLNISGKKFDLRNKRTSNYYTTKEALPLFKENDCGEFEG
ncbi:hypothetical protein [Flavobacterium sp. NKUCC04_CG]|uniref:hypothetical protein n=1 Tax=Flavobacterium sp. NKUCC04_CG TaxID=2842121 RepID=UPI001C5AC653|nr:hypothetical protein [Flavobacterium sp. NKUCC04_CG]MBW3519866.1 hypothetical protein [Flavobacterium sp. NKUCC04_CG]